MLKNDQVWENEKYIIKVEALEKNFRGVIFKKSESGALLFINIVLEDISSHPRRSLTKLLTKMNFNLTDKAIVCRGLN